MTRTIARMRRLAAGLLGMILAVQAAPGGDLLIADFEQPEASRPLLNNVSVEPANQNSPQGNAFVRIRGSTTQPAGTIGWDILTGGAIPGHSHLSALIRSQASTGDINLRWLALDADNQPIFQRRFELPPDQKWVHIETPLHDWRWGDRRAGDWDDVRSLQLRIETQGARFDLDDVRFAGVAKQNDRAAWLLELAFEKRPTRMLNSDGLLIATDSLDGITEIDLQWLHEEMRKIRTFLARVFGDAIRPTDDLGPVPLLIFSTEEAQRQFIRRLGAAWNADVPAPATAGFTIEDIATSTYRKELGPRRPVYLHEATHALVARNLRLLNGSAAHSPMQEGLANYVQLCLYPKSLERRTYVTNFGKSIELNGTGYFKPFKDLLTMRAGTDRYAQVASVTAYLVEKDPPLLRNIVKDLADGATMEASLRRQKLDFISFQNNWFDWGHETFPPGSEDRQEIFPVPDELKNREK